MFARFATNIFSFQHTFIKCIKKITQTIKAKLFVINCVANGHFTMKRKLYFVFF